MLTALTIKNYALIDALQVQFNEGLTIITGETGAGKSILLGGLSLILGKRADLSSVKNPEKKCVIEGVFNIKNYQLQSLFQVQDLDYEPLTIIRREILPSGKSRAFVNDTPVTLDTLSTLGDRLLDIHAQHQTLQLTNDDFQFQVIDALANHAKILKTYQSQLSKFNKATAQLKQLQAQKIEAAKEYDYHLFLLNELEAANLVDGELEMLEAEYETLNNIETIQERLSHTFQLLGEEQMGVLANLTEIKSQLAKLSSFGQQYARLFERINSSLIELEDVSSEIEILQDHLEANPSRLDTVNTKLQGLHNLMQKHVVTTVGELIEIKETLKTKVSDTETIDEVILEKETVLKSLTQDLNQLSAEIRTKRLEIIPELATQLEAVLATLGMPNAKFKIQLEPSDRFLPNGKDHLSFLFSANKGGQFNELKKAASGGELSRIMLAIKSILAQYTQLPTIMFDEIDSGVSGEISNKMGDIMKQMSAHLQVFAITHLPQIAAKGDAHFKVYKEDVNEITQTRLKQLNPEERIVEIAQMLGGVNKSNSALEHARQLLN